MGDSWEVSRVIPVCALTGQAAGTAASMAVDRRLKDINIKVLQQKLSDRGVMFI